MIRKTVICCLTIVFFAAAAATQNLPDQRSDVTALTLLLRLYDTIAAKNPGYDDTLKEIAALDSQKQEARLTVLAGRNSHDVQITALIDTLMASPVYKMFRRIDPEVHRRLLAALPYGTIGDTSEIGQIQLELFRHRKSLAALFKTVSAVNIDQAVSVAKRWAPPGDYRTPSIRYILYGSNDAYARDSAVGFDLYRVIMTKRLAPDWYNKLDSIPPAEIEAVLAHEFQHVFAHSFLWPMTNYFDTWQKQWEDFILRQTVSEGVATACDPPSGLKKALFEDTVIVEFWLREFERVVGLVRRDQITGDSADAWLARSAFYATLPLLDDYMKRTYPAGNPRVAAEMQITDHPSSIYVLGWWMISHIDATPGGHDLVIELLTEPHKLFDLYNATVTDPKLKIAL